MTLLSLVNYAFILKSKLHDCRKTPYKKKNFKQISSTHTRSLVRLQRLNPVVMSLSFEVVNQCVLRKIRKCIFQTSWGGGGGGEAASNAWPPLHNNSVFTLSAKLSGTNFTTLQLHCTRFYDVPLILANGFDCLTVCCRV